MRVGIDFRAMQVGHQFRGIGEVLRQGCRQLDARLPAGDRIVAFYEGRGPAIDDLARELFAGGRPVTGVELPPNGPRLQRLLRDNLSPQQAATITSGCDVWVQFDPGLGIPQDHPSVLVVHDQIPLVLGDRYPAIYWPHLRAARRAGLPAAVSLQRAARRWLYERNLTNALRRAGRVIANSAHTAGTTVQFAHDHGIDDLDGRIEVCLLGATLPETGAINVMERNRVEVLGLDRVPFVLYVGGVDDRRRVDWLVDAFNHLRAGGVDVRLVLAGDSFATVASVGVRRNREALERSSYLHDIHLFGFVSDEQRAWLYEHAAVFVFPSEHEGFGLPVLEALGRGCPVVTFDNSSLREVAGPNTEVVEAGWEPLARAIGHVLDRDEAAAAAATEAGRRWAQGFTWDVLGEGLSRAVDLQRRET